MIDKKLLKEKESEKMLNSEEKRLLVQDLQMIHKNSRSSPEKVLYEGPTETLDLKCVLDGLKNASAIDGELCSQIQNVFNKKEQS